MKATGTLNDDGVDLEMMAELCYGENKVAIIKASSSKMLSNAGKIVGTKGTMTVNSIIYLFSIQDLFRPFSLRFHLSGQQHQ